MTDVVVPPPAADPYAPPSAVDVDGWPLLPPGVPRRHAPRLQAAGKWVLRRLGFRLENAPPPLARQIVVVAPHTSNWDFVAGVSVMAALDLAPRWLGKHTLFRPPFGALLRGIGGIPVRRHGGGASGREGIATMVAEAFRTETRMFLALSPEGTRRRVDRWKSGYHTIARSAGVPVVPCWIDWGRRVVGFGVPVSAEELSADEMEAALRAQYRPAMARHPADF